MSEKTWNINGKHFKFDFGDLECANRYDAACEELLQLVPDPGDRAMVHELYLQRQPVEKVAYDHAYSRSGLYRRVHKAMKEVYKAQE